MVATIASSADTSSAGPSRRAAGRGARRAWRRRRGTPRTPTTARRAAGSAPAARPGIAGDHRQHPAAGERHEVPAGTVGQRPGAAERRDVRDHEPGVDGLGRGQCGVVEVGRAVATADHDVGGGQQPVERGPSVRRRRIDEDRPLAAVEVRRSRAALGTRSTAEVRPDAPQWVAVRSLDLDDVGPEIGEQPPGIGGGERVAVLDHPDAGQRRRPVAAGGHLGSLGRPRARSDNVLRWISSVPPAMRSPGELHRKRRPRVTCPTRRCRR